MFVQHNIPRFFILDGFDYNYPVALSQTEFQFVLKMGWVEHTPIKMKNENMLNMALWRDMV